MPMFIGHYAVALGAKPVAPRVSLGILFLACQLADLLWPNFLLSGLETVRIDPGNTVMTPFDFMHYPYSHSLLALALWATLFAVVYGVLSRAGTRAAIVVALVVLSHWLLDVVTHRPDMPIFFTDTPRIGFGLWNHPAVAVPLELLMFVAGAWLYLRHTKPTDRTGSIAVWALLAFLLVTYAAALLGPPPPSVSALAWSAQAQWLIVGWGFWVDRHRVWGGTPSPSGG